MILFQCIRTAIRNKIHTSEKCMCGILLLGTDKTDNGLNLQHISVLVPLSKLGADHVKEIDEIIKRKSVKVFYIMTSTLL